LKAHGLLSPEGAGPIHEPDLLNGDRIDPGRADSGCLTARVALGVAFYPDRVAVISGSPESDSMTISGEMSTGTYDSLKELTAEPERWRASSYSLEAGRVIEP
jgi:hypothetical protein